MSLIDDIAQDLSNAGLGTVGVNIFKAYLPDKLAEAVAVFDTGGTQPDIYIPDIKEPTFQVFIRANDYSTGKNRLDSVRTRLHDVVNRTIGQTYFYFIQAISEGGHIGRNDRGQDEFSINFRAKIR